MSCARNSRSLSRLGILWGLLSLATLLTAFVSNVWLFTREPVKLPNSEQSTTITFKIGLWRVCPSVNKTNLSQTLPSPACSLVKYSSWDEIKHTDLGIWTTLDFTAPFLTRMRLSTLFEAVSVVVLILATIFSIFGHCNKDQKTIIAAGLYIVGGLILGGGLLVFASVLSDAYLERPQKSDSIREILYSSFSENPYDYRYGWCFMAAGAAFIMAEIAAVFCVTSYLRRFPTMEDMVRVMVPGGERKLREHEGIVSEYLVTHRHESSYRRRQNGPQNLWGISKDLYGTKSESLAPNDQECAEGPLLLSSSAPDVCSSNQTSNVKDSTDADVSSGGCTNAALSAISGVNPDGAEVPPAQLLDIKNPLDYDSHLAGVTVPITLMRTQPLVPVQVPTTEIETIVSPIPTPFLFAQRLQCFGNNTLPANAAVHQGILSVSEGTTATSYSTLDRAMAGSSHKSVNRFSTLQPQKKKGVTVSTFSTMDTYEPPKFSTWNNSEV